MSFKSNKRKQFHLVLIKPSRYDDDGYPLRFRWSEVPSATLAALYTMADDCRERQILGGDVDIAVHVVDDTSYATNPLKLLRTIKAESGAGLVALVGVQSNQFPRAVDIARPFLKNGVPVCLGGFHVSGCFAMLPDLPQEIKEAQDLGISLFLGEAEGGRLDQVLKDAFEGELKPIYDHLRDIPDISNQPTPFLPYESVCGSFAESASLDLGRGCPFECSFCCIINVHGRKSRFRSADDLERMVRVNLRSGMRRFFITDDNFARNRNWESLLDRLIILREKENLDFNLVIQVDTLCHHVSNFIRKAVRAGVDQVFIGLESINPDNLLSVNKKQNKISEYRKMMLAWKKSPVIVIAGYIIGFPGETRESILCDIETIKRELPIDLLSISYLTPLPGSGDHANLVRDGVWMDPDMNKYDLTHRVMHHANMSDEEWESVYRSAWKSFYTEEHIERIFRRMVALRSNKKLNTLDNLVTAFVSTHYSNIYALDVPLHRIPGYGERRGSMKDGSAFCSYLHVVAKVARNWIAAIYTYFRLRRKLMKIWNDPARFEYSDSAISTENGRGK
jgi:hypothetical protein